MKKTCIKQLVGTVCGIVAILAGGSAIAGDYAAEAKMTNSEGREVGTVSFTEGPRGLLLHAELHDLLAGTLAFHLHATGSCSPDFMAGGGHFNPTGKKHGFLAEEGPHLGDMPNIHVPASGTLAFEFYLPEVSLDKGEARLLDDDGATVMIHAKPDDYKTDPAGGAGDRIACGVIQKK